MENWSTSAVAEGQLSIKREGSEQGEAEVDDEGGKLMREEEEEEEEEDGSEYVTGQRPGPEELERIREARRARSIDRFLAGAGGTTTGEEDDDDFKKDPKNKRDSNIQRSLRAAAASKKRMAAAKAKKEEVDKGGSGSSSTSSASASAKKGKAKAPTSKRDAGKSPSAKGRRELLSPKADAKAKKGDNDAPEEGDSETARGARPKRGAGAQRAARKFEGVLTLQQEQRVTEAVRAVDVYNSPEVTHRTIAKMNATIASVTGFSAKKFDGLIPGDVKRRREAAKMDAIYRVIGEDELIPRPIAIKKRLVAVANGDLSSSLGHIYPCTPLPRFKEWLKRTEESQTDSDYDPQLGPFSSAKVHPYDYTSGLCAVQSQMEMGGYTEEMFVTENLLRTW